MRKSIALSIIAALLAAGCAHRANHSATTSLADARSSESEQEKSGVGAALGSVTMLVGGISNLFQNFSGNTPALYARMMESENPDNRWQGMSGLVEHDFAKRPPYTTRYRQIAASDPDFLVRATAIRSLNRSRDAGASGVFVRALNDPSDRVRLEAAKALVHLPDPNAPAPLIRLVTKADENKDVRIAAADALRHYRTLEVARTLATAISNRDFGIAWQAHRSLRTVTRREYGYDEAAWLNFLTGPEKPFG
jgi:HEAT repeat protein